MIYYKNNYIVSYDQKLFKLIKTIGKIQGVCKPKFFSQKSILKYHKLFARFCNIFSRFVSLIKFYQIAQKKYKNCEFKKIISSRIHLIFSTSIMSFFYSIKIVKHPIAIFTFTLLTAGHFSFYFYSERGSAVAVCHILLFFNIRQRYARKCPLDEKFFLFFRVTESDESKSGENLFVYCLCRKEFAQRLQINSEIASITQQIKRLIMKVKVFSFLRFQRLVFR